MKYLKIFTLWTILIATTIGQENIPISKKFKQAVKKQTRTMKGVPGEKYWQNRTSYIINAEVIASEKKLIGQETIIFENNSPDTLDRIVMHVYQNLYQKGNPIDQFIHPDDIYTGVKINKLLIKEKPIAETESIGTLLLLNLKEDINPSEVITIEVKWEFTIPSKSDIRMGAKDSTSFFLGHWFPRVAVYDDLKGWDENLHSGGEEFYYDIGSFDYSVTVPQGYIVWGTGLLQNADEVLSDKILDRFNSALISDSIISVINELDYRKNFSITNNNIWRYKANNVSDVAFGTSNHFLWDAGSILINNQRVLVQAAYPAESKDFKEVAELAQKTTQYFSIELPGVSYPFPAVTVFNGTNGRSGMEYPMIANDPSADNRGRTVDVTAHEIAHNYFPFYVLTNETEYAWMDEAFAAMMPYQYQQETEPTLNRITRYAKSMSEFADSEWNVASATQTSLLKDKITSFNFYTKPTIALYVLQDMLGKKLFKACLLKYIETWKGKHPTQEDFFLLMNEVSQNNLNWFWNRWFYGNGFPDLGIENVEQTENGYSVTIRKNGDLPVPIILTAYVKGKDPKVYKYTAEVWQKSDKKMINIKTDLQIEKFKLGSEYIPDTNIDDNYYQ